MKSLSFGRVLALGGLTIGILDALCGILRGALSGVPAGRVMQSVASGLLGQAAFKGGAQMVALGTLLHFFIATMVMLVYLLASRRIGWLNANPWVSGVVYGLVVFVVMNFVVLPLSAVTLSPRTLSRLLPGVFIHLVAVGLPAALIARRAAPPAPTT